MRRSSPSGDAGQAMLPLLVVVSLSLLAVIFWLLVPWGAATTEKAQAQTAADAAALAAADAQRKGWVRDTMPPGLDVATGIGRAQGLALGRGCGEASTYAGRNGATVVDCRVVRHRGDTAVRVTVRLDDTSDPRTGRAEATAVASIDIDIDRCIWRPGPPPTPLEYELVLTCGDYEAGYVFPNPPAPAVATRYSNGIGWGLLHDRLEPRLVE